LVRDGLARRCPRLSRPARRLVFPQYDRGRDESVIQLLGLEGRDRVVERLGQLLHLIQLLRVVLVLFVQEAHRIAGEDVEIGVVMLCQKEAAFLPDQERDRGDAYRPNSPPNPGRDTARARRGRRCRVGREADPELGQALAADDAVFNLHDRDLVRDLLVLRCSAALSRLDRAFLDVDHLANEYHVSSPHEGRRPLRPWRGDELLGLRGGRGPEQGQPDERRDEARAGTHGSAPKSGRAPTFKDKPMTSRRGKKIVETRTTRSYKSGER